MRGRDGVSEDEVEDGLDLSVEHLAVPFSALGICEMDNRSGLIRLRLNQFGRERDGRSVGREKEGIGGWSVGE